MLDITEILYEDDEGEFFWPMCAKKGCLNGRTHDSDLYCYPHSRWYRPIKRYWNLFISFLEDFTGDK